MLTQTGEKMLMLMKELFYLLLVQLTFIVVVELMIDSMQYVSETLRKERVIMVQLFNVNTGMTKTDRRGP